jgi:hypothetical protein
MGDARLSAPGQGINDAPGNARLRPGALRGGPTRCSSTAPSRTPSSRSWRPGMCCSWTPPAVRRFAASTWACRHTRRSPPRTSPMSRCESERQDAAAHRYRLRDGFVRTAGRRDIEPRCAHPVYRERARRQHRRRQHAGSGRPGRHAWGKVGTVPGRGSDQPRRGRRGDGRSACACRASATRAPAPGRRGRHEARTGGAAAAARCAGCEAGSCSDRTRATRSRSRAKSTAWRCGEACS